MKRRIRRLLQLTWKDRSLLCEATVLLAFARFAVLLLPFRIVMAYCGIHETVDSPKAATADDESAVVRVAWSVSTVSRYTPWRSECLVRAIAATHMLRRRHLHTSLYLGLRKDKPGSLSAHAWLRCGNIIVTGGLGHKEFTVVATFAQS